MTEKEDCIFCGKVCVCESYIIWEDLAKVHDINAKLEGFLETKRIVFYVAGCIPTYEKQYNTPCLMFEELDEEISTEEVKVMKPVYCINLTKEQSDKMKEFMKDTCS